MRKTRPRSVGGIWTGRCQRSDSFGWDANCSRHRKKAAVTLLFLFSTISLFADEESKFDWFKPLSSWTGEYSIEETYISDANVRHGQREINGFNESDTIIRFV